MSAQWFRYFKIKWILRTQSITGHQNSSLLRQKKQGGHGQVQRNTTGFWLSSRAQYRPKRHYRGSGHGEGASQHPHPPRPHEHSYLHDYLPIPRLLLEAPEATLCRNCPVEPLALHPGFRDLSGCAASDDLHLNHAPVTCKCCSHPVEE